MQKLKTEENTVKKRINDAKKKADFLNLIARQKQEKSALRSHWLNDRKSIEDNNREKIKKDRYDHRQNLSTTRNRDLEDKVRNRMEIRE